jgi:hypothetical protein
LTLLTLSRHGTDHDQIPRIFHGFEMRVRVPFCAIASGDFFGGDEKPTNQRGSGGRTRDRTLDLSRVKGTPSRRRLEVQSEFKAIGIQR